MQGSDGSTTANLEIIDAIRASDNQSAKLVVVLVKADMKLLILAKIYDPLYYDHEQDDADPFLCVDRDYSPETAVYNALPTQIVPGNSMQQLQNPLSLRDYPQAKLANPSQSIQQKHAKISRPYSSAVKAKFPLQEDITLPPREMVFSQMGEFSKSTITTLQSFDAASAGPRTSIFRRCISPCLMLYV
ncbi:hypothetical protein ACJ72_07011 [Emergomyces africanus]|uniref:Uncharacterized protein n=1 Tax=Emergomyces africanus TaxID=1955775 RepID=A0A1B7NPY5_9EURO|nr:hypothetical protein ACJ72_07011 [Emergomyces africanus]